MMCRHTFGVLLLALLTAACGSPTGSDPPAGSGGSPEPAETSTSIADSQPPAAATTTTVGRAPNPPAKRPAQPTAKGQPLDIFLPFDTGISYKKKEQGVEKGIRAGCGGTLCVKVALIVSVTRDPSVTEDCIVSRVDKPEPIYAGDTIKIYVEDLCDGRAPGSTSGRTTTTTTTTG
jgi:hypothetical protein